MSNDVGGGTRLLGNAELINSTISGNESTGWYGGALYLTDGVMNMVNSTLTHALLGGSPAIDSADNGLCPAIDQRGEPREVACDVGAFEFP